MKRWVAAILAVASVGAAAQTTEAPNSILLVAKPELADPNFRETVVLVTQAADASTVGVILNRPTARRHEKTGEAIYAGGPVMRQVLVAVFRSHEAPPAAFQVLRGVYLTMHPDNMARLLQGGAMRRLYAGFSGWAPGQLQGEMLRDAWHVLPATEELLFREKTDGMWQELLAKAHGARTRRDGEKWAEFHAR